MHKSIARAAFKIVTQAKTLIPDSGTSRAVCEIAEVGRVKGRQIALTRECRGVIERVFSWELGMPLVNIDFDIIDRTAAASLHDEKWAKEGVFANLICVSTLGKWPIKGVSNIPAGVILASEAEAFDFTGIDAVVLVENGEILRTWPMTSALMPSPFNHAVAIYRGHGENINKVKSLIDTLSIPVGLYFDYDPAGIDMAAREKTKDNHHIIIPDAPTDLLVKETKKSAIEKQFPISLFWEYEDPKLMEHMRRMRQSHIAVMQEKIAVMGISLKVLG